MLLNKTWKVAASLCLMATVAVAQQLPQMVQLPAQGMAPTKIQMEQLKKNFDVMKKQGVLPRKAMNLNAQIKSGMPMRPMTGVIPGAQKVMTRAEGFGAYYEMPSGLYNIKSGFQYRTSAEVTSGADSISRHGILAPIFQDIVFKNASTNAENIDWYINETLVVNEDSIVAIYVPGQDFYVPMPELTAYAAGAESIYQYGYALNRETSEYTPGQAVTDTWGMVHNMDVGAETFYDSYISTMNATWSQMLFGSNDQIKPSYFEIFEKPFHPVVLNSLYTYVATASNNDLSNVNFSMFVMAFDEASQQWVPITNEVSSKPAYLGSMEECDIWHMQMYFEKPVLVDKQFAIVFAGPQDGTTPWALLSQDNRDLYSGKCTAGYIPSTGEYAGYMMPYAFQPEGSTEALPYPTSIDLGLQMFMPYNMVLDPSTYEYLNYGDIQVDAAGLTAQALLWNWESYIMGSQSSMTITSSADWLKAEVTRAAADNNFLSEISVTVEPMPADVTSRYAYLTFTDGQGYQSTWGFYQPTYDPNAIEKVVGTVELDPNAPIYDLTGRQVSNPTKGIYLQNGKKFVVE